MWYSKMGSMIEYASGETVKSLLNRNESWRGVALWRRKAECNQARKTLQNATERHSDLKPCRTRPEYAEHPLLPLLRLFRFYMRILHHTFPASTTLLLSSGTRFPRFFALFAELRTRVNISSALTSPFCSRSVDTRLRRKYGVWFTGYTTKNKIR